LRPYTILRGQW